MKTNARRTELVKKKHHVGLSEAETIELDELNKEFVAFLERKDRERRSTTASPTKRFHSERYTSKHEG